MNCYFIVRSEHIVFDGKNNNFYINNIDQYNGLISNGVNIGGLDAYSNISINNIHIKNNNSELSITNGWICRFCFGVGQHNLEMNNCSSDGNCPLYGGGLVGCFAECNVSNSFYTGDMFYLGGGIIGPYCKNSIIKNCYTTGYIHKASGGICGLYSENMTVEQCYSLGIIDHLAGGIFGPYTISCSATSCYSVGDILFEEESNVNIEEGNGAGGIFSSFNEEARMVNCYSLGNIGKNCGGIISSFSTNYFIINCFSTGVINAEGYGITNPLNSNGAMTFTYAANGNWDFDMANSNLIGVPDNIVGLFWTHINDDYYVLSTIGNTPYMTASSSSYATSNPSGSNTIAPLYENYYYSIVDISDNFYFTSSLNDTGIYMDDNIIYIGDETLTGVYYLKISQTSMENGNDIKMTNYVLYVNMPLCFNKGTKILSLSGGSDVYKNIENMNIGDYVKTYKHGYKKIKYIHSGKMINNVDHYSSCMYIMKKNKDMIDDLIVTGGHSILVEEISEKEYVRQKKIMPDMYIDGKNLLLAGISDNFIKKLDSNIYEYWHIVLENDDVERRYGIYANGLLVETLSEKMNRDKN